MASLCKVYMMRPVATDVAWSVCLCVGHNRELYKNGWIDLECKKGKGSPYSITERRVPRLIPVLGSQPAGDVSHKPGGRLPLGYFPPGLQLPRNP